MLTATERTAIEGELAEARATVARIEAAFTKWRNALSYLPLGTWSEDAATTRARERLEAAELELRALELEALELEASPLAGHEELLGLLERARRLSSSDAAHVIEAEGRASNLGAILTDGARETVRNASQIAGGAAKELGDQVFKLPPWVWVVGLGVLAVAVLPAVLPLLLAAGGRKGRR